MSRSLRVRQACIDQAKHAVRRNGFPSQRALAEEIGMSLATVSNFLTGKPVDRATFLELCDRLGLDSKAIADSTSESEDPLSQRTLAAIVFTDVVSFTERISADEYQTLSLVQRDFQRMKSLCQQFAGRVLKSLGDGLLLYFNSAEQAVLCAIAIQKSLTEAAADLPPEAILQHRIGIDLGDVVYNDNDVMGSRVNLASRLQAQASPGGICVSQAVYDVVKSSLSTPITYLGERRLKGVKDPLPIYQITLFPPPSPPESPPLPVPSPELPSGSPFRQDWGEAMDVSLFYGRVHELSTLEQWIESGVSTEKPGQCCRLISIIGMGGIGKTALSIKLAEQLQDKFEFVVWRSLRNAPSLSDLLADLLTVLSCQQDGELPKTLGNRITYLIEHLRKSRCLLVLDNTESILCTGDRAGSYLSGYEAYGQFFQNVGESRHQSCLVLTSREMPGGLMAKAGETSPIRTFRLAGLAVDNAQAILAEKGIFGAAPDTHLLIDYYSGNPLALKIASTIIQELFAGDVAQFLAQGTAVFGDIFDLLEQQFNRLTAFEQQVMYWLAIAREWTSLAELREDILPSAPHRVLLESLESLQHRCLIEKSLSSSPRPGVTFTQQPVVMEYVTERLIIQVCQEMQWGELNFLERYGLSQAYAKDYVRKTQRNLILRPIIEQLLRELGDREAVKSCLDQILLKIKARSVQPPGYAAGNVLNLLNQLDIDLSGYDFSYLNIWQIYLQGINLRRVNFSHANFAKSVLTQTLGDLLSISFSPDGTLLAIGIDRQILLWHIGDRRQLVTLEGHTAWVMAVAFSPDGALLASGSNDQTIRLWNVQTGQCLKTLQGHTGEVQTIAFSPDGQRLASGSNDRTIQVWEVQTCQRLRVLQGHGDHLLTVLFTPNSQQLVSSSDDQTVRLWDVESGVQIRTIPTHVNWVLSLALSPDGITLVTGSDESRVKFWNLQTGEYQGTLDYGAKVWAIAFSPDGYFLATASADKTVRIWDVRTRHCVKTLHNHPQPTWLVAFSPDGKTLVSSGEEQSIKLWDLASEQCLVTLESHSNWIATIALSLDGRMLVSGSKDQLVRLWDLETGDCIRLYRGHTDAVTCVAFSPLDIVGNQVLASGSDDYTIKLWDMKTGECLKTLRGHTDWVQAIAFSPDGKILVSGSCDTTVKVWDLQSGECLHTLTEHTHRVKAVAFHPAGTAIVSGSGDHTVKCWDAQTMDCMQTLAGHTEWVLSLSYSPDGKHLATGSGDRTIKFWDLSTGNCLRTLEGHRSRVRSVSFSPDGQTLASGGEDCQIKLWDIATGACLQTWKGHEQIVWMVTFASGGKTLVSCSEDGTIRIWQTESGSCLNILRLERPYEGMNITGTTGLTVAQRATLCALGAVAE